MEDWEDRSSFGNRPGTVEGGTDEYPSTDKDTPHVQRDGWVWDDETGWNPPAN